MSTHKRKPDSATTPTVPTTSASGGEHKDVVVDGAVEPPAKRQKRRGRPPSTLSPQLRMLQQTLRQAVRRNVYAKVLSASQQILALQVDHEDALFRKAWAQFKLQTNKQEAMQSFALCLEKYPAHLFARLDYIILLDEAKQNDKMRQLCDEGIVYHPQEPLFFHNRAVVWDREKQGEKAIQDQLHAVALKPYDAYLQLRLARYYLEYNHVDDCIKLCTIVLDERPRWRHLSRSHRATALLRRALSYQQLSKTKSDAQAQVRNLGQAKADLLNIQPMYGFLVEEEDINAYQQLLRDFDVKDSTSSAPVTAHVARSSSADHSSALDAMMMALAAASSEEDEDEDIESKDMLNMDEKHTVDSARSRQALIRSASPELGSRPPALLANVASNGAKLVDASPIVSRPPPVTSVTIAEEKTTLQQRLFRQLQTYTAEELGTWIESRAAAFKPYREVVVYNGMNGATFVCLLQQYATDRPSAHNFLKDMLSMTNEIHRTRLLLDLQYVL